MPKLKPTTGIPASVAALVAPASVRGDQGGGDAVDLGVHRGLDQLRLLVGLRIVGVGELRPMVLRRLLRAGPDLVPEAVAESRG